MSAENQSKPLGICPICGKPTDAGKKPFCSSRCRNVDLNRWLQGSYAIPADDGEESADAPPIAPEAGEDRR
jgi:endogenous inhibitor of DNA gyrase (YacG/DUF329 family)